MSKPLIFDRQRVLEHSDGTVKVLYSKYIIMHPQLVRSVEQVIHPVYFKDKDSTGDKTSIDYDKEVIIVDGNYKDIYNRIIEHRKNSIMGIGDELLS